MGQRSTRTHVQQTLPFCGAATDSQGEAAVEEARPEPFSPGPDLLEPLPAAVVEGPARLEATVKKGRFECAGTGFAVLSMRSRDLLREFTAVGPLAGFRVGQDLVMTGRWVHSPRFGEQFRVQDVEAVEISSLDGIRAHLEDCPVSGVGPRLAAALVRTFGLETWEVIAAQPGRLAEVPGLRPPVAEALHAYARDHRKLAQLASLLRKGGVGPAIARRVYAHYRARGADPVEVTTSDPFRTARDVDHIGFEKADRIAAAIGLPRDAAPRIRAGLRHVLKRAAEQSGHCFLPAEELVQDAGRLLSLPGEKLEPELTAMVEDPLELLQPDRVCLEAGAVYLAPLLEAERTIADRVRALLAHQPAVPAGVVPEAITRAERLGPAGFAYNAEQRQAIEQLARSNLVIVTGGPGTGKTTLVQGLIAVLDALGLRVSLAAPTGRASQRLRESTGRHASTVHRLLRYDHGAGGFRSDSAHSLRGALIVDEFSMMDAWLSAHLFRALDPASPAVLVGDVDQLPPVGPGAVLRHLIDSGMVPTVRLQVPLRQAAGSRLVTNAHRVNAGQEPEFPEGDPECAWLPIEPGVVQPEEAAARVVATALELARARGLFHTQVLAPMKRGPLGVDALNDALQAHFAGEGPALRLAGRTYRHGDKVIQTRNDHDRGVMNGEIGRVVAVDAARGTLAVEFRHRDSSGQPDGGGRAPRAQASEGPGRSPGSMQIRSPGEGSTATEPQRHVEPGDLVVYGTEELEHLRLAYAVTIHKSQGSEYDAALVVLHDSHMFMLQRNLVYTALTRARKHVVVAGTRRALRRAVTNARVAARHSRLLDRVRER